MAICLAILSISFSIFFSTKANSSSFEATPTTPDSTLSAAERFIGKPLILRGFYTTNDLNYDSMGRIIGSPKVSDKTHEKVDDWTLAGINVQKVSRRERNELLLDGIRVAIKFNQDSRQFERHAQNDQAIRISLLTAGTGELETRGLEAALAAIFAIGIDPDLQRSTPTFWRHYFEPGLPWGKDELSDIHIYTRGQAAPNSDEAKQLAKLVNPVVEHRITAHPSPIAAHDRVNGEIELRMVIDAEGTPRRVAIVRPLGYGLDVRAVEAVQKWKFKPGAIDGEPVATTVILREQFEELTPPHP